MQQTLLPHERIGPREKLILAGLYLSKYDAHGLKKLGFESFVQAFNVIGYALRGKPSSIKNYRDEFDPLFPNKRKGWHKRPTRHYCLKVFEKYKRLEFETFTALLRSFVDYDENALSVNEPTTSKAESESLFAKRLVTGLAAEHYFESVQPHIPEFKNCIVENTTRLGCGYDFRLKRGANTEFLAVEVKGLNERSGSLSFTPKEYHVASCLADRFFLFVVKNFRESPSHDIYRNPLAGSLRFAKKEQVVVQISWLTTV